MKSLKTIPKFPVSYLNDRLVADGFPAFSPLKKGIEFEGPSTVTAILLQCRCLSQEQNEAHHVEGPIGG